MSNPTPRVSIRCWSPNTYGSTQVDLSLTVTDTPPSILTHPSGAWLPAGGNTTLAVSARGSSPLRYQWRFNGQDISGATNPALVLDNLNYNQTGYYDVAVSNPFGTVVSAKVLLTVAQTVYVWGQSSYYPYYSLPTNVPPGLANVVALAAGNSHVLALKRDGTVATWAPAGAPTSLTTVPASVTNVIAIAAGGNSSMALRGNGTVVVWGDSYYGQINVPTAATNVVAIADGGNHCLALKANGTIVGWGNNSYHQTEPPAGLSNVVALAAGYATSLALRNDGTPVVWGYTNGMLPPPGLTNLLAVSADSANYSSATAIEALGTDGSVSNWGEQAGGMPSSVSNIIAISAGGRARAALKSDGRVTWWNSSSWTNLPSSRSNFVALAAGGSSSPFVVAVIGDGSPAITIQPASQTTTNGATVRLHTRAIGTPPLGYQWQLNGAMLPGATNADFNISNVQGTNSGNYQVLVTNALGAVISRIAQVTIPCSTNLPAALNATNLVWTTSPTDAPWFAQVAVTHDGAVAAQSGHIAHSQQSFLQTTVTGPGLLACWWKVSSEEGYDYLKLLDTSTGLPLASISGEVDWQQLSLNIPAGTHILRWIYAKDFSVSVGQDAGWLDQVTFTPLPLITQHPQSQTARMGSSVTFQAGATWSGIAYLQWLKNGTNLPDAHSLFLSLTNLTRRDSGTYALQVTNVAGSVTSSNATLLVRVPQRLAAPHLLPDGGFAFSSGDADGGWLRPEDLAGLGIQASTNLVNWVALPNALALTNGLLVIRDSGRTNYAARFYRMVEH